MSRLSLLVLLGSTLGLGACVGAAGDARSESPKEPYRGGTGGAAYPSAPPSGSPGYPSPAYPGSPGPGGDGLGVTPGGAKDIGFARDVIKKGGVPVAASITVEGLLSEHDIPVDGEPCSGLMCTRPALGVAQFLETGRREHFVQIGFASGFSKSSFRRPPLDVVVLIDHSAGMAIDQTETNAAVASLVDKMRDDDRLGVLIFNDKIETLAALGPVADKEALKARVRAVNATGGFAVMPAMEAAYATLEALPDDPRRLRRVIVFSCGYPSVSDAESDPTRSLVQRGAAKRIGLTFFGVLLGWNRALADLLGQARGGSYHYLQDLAQIEKVFDVDFDFMVTPILYDLKLAVEPGAAFEVVKLYGMPGTPDESRPAPANATPPPGAGQGQTGGAFLSSRKGAIVAHLRLKDGVMRGGSVGSVSLAYEPEPAVGFGDLPVQERVEIADVTDPASLETEVFQGKGVHLAAVLLNQATRMKAACDAFHKGMPASAGQILDELITYLSKEADTLGHQGLRDEVALVTKLRANIKP